MNYHFSTLKEQIKKKRKIGLFNVIRDVILDCILKKKAF